MARHLAWILTATLVSAAPASASAVCDHEGDAPLGGQRGDHPQDRIKDGKQAGKDDHPPWKFWQGDTKTELGITNQQSSEIEAIFQSTRPRLEAAKDKIDKLEATLSQTIKDNTADLATVAQQVDRLEVARADLYKTRTLMLYRMRGLRSADQRARLQAAWEAGRARSNDAAGRR
jgi:Spy/CpxP family protein refolding chaperone